MAHPELAAEQAYVDNAYEQLDRMRSTVARTQDAMATEWASLNMEAWAKRRMRTFEDAERGLVFGRLALDGRPRPRYVGRRWVHDDEHESLVVNWQAPAARPFYTATPQAPHCVQQRRRFRAEGRRLTDISDESLDGSAVEGASVSDFLLEELERRRDVRMRDIVATIQSDQYRLITADPEGALVVQGGPGTGKTAVGLHRASWLLYTHSEQVLRSGSRASASGWPFSAASTSATASCSARAHCAASTSSSVRSAVAASSRAGSTASSRCLSRRSSSRGCSLRRPRSGRRLKACSTPPTGSSCYGIAPGASPTSAGATRTWRCSTRRTRSSRERRA